MIKGALEYLKTNVIKERIIKPKDRAESEKFFNYPYQAFEEAVVNALYHRDYQEREPVEIDFLDEDELRKIINFDSPLPRLERAKDMFLFGCFTGLSYIDIKTLEPQHFEKDGAGRIWIKKRRVKTGILSRIPLLPMAKLILDKYKGSERLLPIQDSADVNKYLKDIAILCKINKRITFHTSRHTFASTVTLANNISLEVVSKMLGHTNTRMTTHYAQLIDKCIGEQMDKLMDTFSGESDY